MRTFVLLMFLSLVGMGIVGTTVYFAEYEKSGDTVPLATMKVPFTKFIAGTGVVEADSKNIFVGSQVNGVIKKIFVQSGDKIRRSQQLFEIDASKKKAQLSILEAAVKVSQIKFSGAKDQFEILKKMKEVSVNMVTKEQYTKSLNLLNEAKAMLLLSRSKVDALKKELALYKIYAPVNGRVLRSNITEGSFFNANSQALVLGSDTLDVKININEFDSWRFIPKSDAVAFVRGNPKEKINLEYKYTIPFIVPKKNLKGISTEQTDTRVLQVVYSVKGKTRFPLYVGEMLDVFIKTSKGR